MSGKRSGLQGRSEAAVIAFYVGIAAAIGVALLADGLARIVALSVLGLFALNLLIGDVLLAMSDERATKRNPHDNRISDVGRKATVVEDFVAGPAGSYGRVALAGETWKARSPDGTLHRAGDELVVAGVEGLVLVVEAAAVRQRAAGRG